MPWPMPDPPPVTAAIWPCNSPAISFSLDRLLLRRFGREWRHRRGFGQGHQPVAERLDLAPADRLGGIDDVIGIVARALEVEGRHQTARLEIGRHQRIA